MLCSLWLRGEAIDMNIVGRDGGLRWLELEEMSEQGELLPINADHQLILRNMVTPQLGLFLLDV